MTVDNYVNIASSKNEQICKLINKIPGSSLLISSLPGSASRKQVESLSKPRDSTSTLKSLPGKLDIRRQSATILYFHTPLQSTQYHMFTVTQP